MFCVDHATTRVFRQIIIINQCRIYRRCRKSIATELRLWEAHWTAIPPYNVSAINRNNTIITLYYVLQTVIGSRGMIFSDLKIRHFRVSVDAFASRVCYQTEFAIFSLYFAIAVWILVDLVTATLSRFNSDYCYYTHKRVFLRIQPDFVFSRTKIHELNY